MYVKIKYGKQDFQTEMKIYGADGGIIKART